LHNKLARKGGTQSTKTAKNQWILKLDKGRLPDNWPATDRSRDSQLKIEPPLNQSVVFFLVAVAIFYYLLYCFVNHLHL